MRSPTAAPCLMEKLSDTVTASAPSACRIAAGPSAGALNSSAPCSSSTSKRPRAEDDQVAVPVRRADRHCGTRPPQPPRGAMRSAAPPPRRRPPTRRPARRRRRPRTGPPAGSAPPSRATVSRKLPTMMAMAASIARLTTSAATRHREPRHRRRQVRVGEQALDAEPGPRGAGGPRRRNHSSSTGTSAAAARIRRRAPAPRPNTGSPPTASSVDSHPPAPKSTAATRTARRGNRPPPVPPSGGAHRVEGSDPRRLRRRQRRRDEGQRNRDGPRENQVRRLTNGGTTACDVT